MVLMVNLVPVHAIDQIDHKFTEVQTTTHEKTSSTTADSSLTIHENPHLPNGATITIKNNQEYKYRYTNKDNELNFKKRKQNKSIKIK